MERSLSNTLVRLCLNRCACRAYATIWQWLGTTGLDRSVVEHLLRGPTPFSPEEGLRAAARCKGPWVAILAGSIVPVVYCFIGRGTSSWLPVPLNHTLYLSMASRRLFNGSRVACLLAVSSLSWEEIAWKAGGTLPPPPFETKNTILCGGSLGSCVDEERSQLR